MNRVRNRTARRVRTRFLALAAAAPFALAFVAISLAASPLAAPTITSKPPNPSASTSASFSFSGPVGATFECKFDGAASFTSCTSPKNYPGLATGGHTFRVRAKKSGDTSAETTYTWSIVVPTASITSGPADPTNSQSASFVFTADASDATFECKLDSPTFVLCTSPKGYSGLGAGSHTFQVRAKGSAGTGAPATRIWTIDLTAPGAPTITFPPPSPAWTQTASPAATFTGEAGGTFQCKLDSGSFAACTSPKAYSGLSQGSHTFQVKQTDAAGNTGPAGARTFQIDSIAPTQPVFSQKPPDPNNTATSTFAWSSTDPAPASGIAGYLCSKENGAYLPCSSPYTYNVQTTNNGQHQFAAVAVDFAGNISQAATYKWKVAAGTHADFTVAGSVSGLMIGVWKSIPITITNPNSDPISVTILTVAVSGSPNGCDATTNFETQPAVVPFTVPANAVDYAVPLANQPQIRLKNLPGPSPANNQDNCKNQTINLAYSGSANGP
jgi:hypothetical protein